MTGPPAESPAIAASGPEVSRDDVARGAGLAGLARLGAAIEILSQPLFTWLFGLATYGLYVVLWAAVKSATSIASLAMTSALQRVVPAAASEEEAHALVKGAILLTLLPAILIALIVSLNADAVASLFSAAPADRARLPGIIGLFAWALPFWAFIEIATSAARARRAFGPEIRLRIFWEQVARILFALGFAAIGFHSAGLMYAHLASLALTALLCIPLIGRYYDWRLLAVSPLPLARVGRLAGTGLALSPSTLSHRLLIDAPPLALNLLIPGAQGAVAAALFEIARKLSTVPLIVRQAFQYVMAPLSSAQAAADRARIEPLYRFATRVSAALVIPLAGLLIFAGADILSLYRPEAAAALPLLAILVGARAAEAVAGPATPIIEMTGHPALPLLNSLLAVALWAGGAVLLVPDFGALGMASAVALATIAAALAATLELRVAEGLSPLDRNLGRGLLIALAGIALMAIAESLLGGPARFAAVLILWSAASWSALRFGLDRQDRQALGPFARKLRLLPRTG